MSVDLNPTVDELERFWAKITKTDNCWLWNSNTSDGYGFFKMGGRVMRAHRISWALANGMKMPKSNMFVCHKCDNRRCVRPDHLFLGTVQENVKDMIQKGRNRGGKNQPFHAPRTLKYYLSYIPSRKEWEVWMGGLFLGSHKDLEIAASILQCAANGGEVGNMSARASNSLPPGIQWGDISSKW